MLCGITGPSFGEFSYFFQMNVVEFSKFQYAMFNVLGYFSLTMGTIYYNTYLKDHEVRTLLRWACVIGVVGSLLSLIFALRLNLIFGVSDLLTIVFSDVVLGTLGLAYSQLPTMVLFAKITPASIEATCFAFLTGTFNFSNGVIAPMMGTTINDLFVGVTSDDLSKYPYLCAIQMAASLIPFFFLTLVPLKDQIKRWQEDRSKKDKKGDHLH